MFFMGSRRGARGSVGGGGRSPPSHGERRRSRARLAALEDPNAIRALLQRYVRLVNTGAHASCDCSPTVRTAIDRSIRSLASDADVAIAVAADGTATARVACTVETATPIESCGTLVEMARLQGDGFVARSERRVLVSSFVKTRRQRGRFESAESRA